MAAGEEEMSACLEATESVPTQERVRWFRLLRFRVNPCLRASLAARPRPDASSAIGAGLTPAADHLAHPRRHRDALCDRRRAAGRRGQQLRRYPPEVREAAAGRRAARSRRRTDPVAAARPRRRLRAARRICARSSSARRFRLHLHGTPGSRTSRRRSARSATASDTAGRRRGLR